MDRRLALLGVLGVHLVVAASHGVTHELVPVRLGPALNVLVLVTTFLGPIVGVALDWRDHHLGVPLFTVSMAGALALGGVLHFVLETPDHVHSIPAGAWQLPFQATAGAVALTTGLGTLVGARDWRQRQA